MFCHSCDKQNDDRAIYCQGCGAPLAATQTAPAAAVSIGVTYSGFWVRFAAFFIDCVIIIVGSAVFGAVTFGAGFVVGFAGPWLYEAFMLSSEWQATVGKRAMSIAVTDLDGRRLSFARATGRHFAKYVSAFLLGIGFIIAAFSNRKQALHDMIAETVVINKIT